MLLHCLITTTSRRPKSPFVAHLPPSSPSVTRSRAHLKTTPVRPPIHPIWQAHRWRSPPGHRLRRRVPPAVRHKPPGLCASRHPLLLRRLLILFLGSEYGRSLSSSHCRSSSIRLFSSTARLLNSTCTTDLAGFESGHSVYGFSSNLNKSLAMASLKAKIGKIGTCCRYLSLAASTLASSSSIVLTKALGFVSDYQQSCNSKTSLQTW